MTRKIIFVVVNFTLFICLHLFSALLSMTFFLFEEENYEQNMLPTLNMRISKIFDIKKESLHTASVNKIGNNFLMFFSCVAIFSDHPRDV